MEAQYSGMTVNERLYVSGLVTEFDQAIEEKNTHKIIWILKQVEVGEENIYAILKNHNLTG